MELIPLLKVSAVAVKVLGSTASLNSSVTIMFSRSTKRSIKVGPLLSAGTCKALKRMSKADTDGMTGLLVMSSAKSAVKETQQVKGPIVQRLFLCLMASKSLRESVSVRTVPSNELVADKMEYSL